MSTRPLLASSLVFAPAALLVFLGLAVGGSALARDCDGVSFPEHIQVGPIGQAGGATLTLNGLGLRKATIFGIKVYVAGLYVPHPTADAAAILSAREPAQIELRFVFRATAGQLRDAWREGFEKSAGADLPRLQSRIAQLQGWMHGVKSGQRMTFLRIPGVGIRYSLDGTPEGTIQGADFARAFLAIWLGPAPPNPGLRAGLLGGPCE